LIFVDVNILVYAYNKSAPHHQQAAVWWEAQVNSAAPVGICWPVFQGFMRLLGGRHIVAEPYSAKELFKIAEDWWARPSVRLLGATSQTYARYRSLMENYALSGAMSTDALIAAFSLEHGATLFSNDTDFLRFRELRIKNPLA
jgi:uncharacterized protein